VFDVSSVQFSSVIRTSMHLWNSVILVPTLAGSIHNTGGFDLIP